ncbi:uncharacterized protein LOC129909166 [Episyrphus balteatus]|uniref:uncharacterized protein LOC129909166 n=1 Tax=Episyrphus balteatus TaxID=286459 RepID=UPI00248624AE|nr:uncharacterized protein LOC129909166 [Episyrphus balteatus]
MKKILRYWFYVFSILTITNKELRADNGNNEVDDDDDSVSINNNNNCPAICGDGKDSSHNLCLSSLTQQDCAPNEYITPNAGICNCCPLCVGGLGGLHEECNEQSPCAMGLKCDKTMTCQLDKNTCAYSYHLAGVTRLPSCEVDGSFAAVQCKGDRLSGRCFCYSETGKRIHGWSWWRESEGMTCACSRMKYKMIQDGLGDNTLHCDSMGNFEALQCTGGVCWCAEPTTGQILSGTRAVPEAMWKFLPCYDFSKFGSTYLRQCESSAYAQNLLKKAYAAHGTTEIEFNNILCDYDGSYGRYSISNGIASCYWRDGTRLGSFQVQSNKVTSMNCYCARDQKIFSEAGMIHRLTCSGNGNYESIQDINGKIFCVDGDGFAVSDPVETDILPDCSKYIYYETRGVLD